MLVIVRVLPITCGLHSCSSAFPWISPLNADSASQSDFLLCFPDPLAGVDLLNEVASLFTTVSYYCCICLRQCLDLVPHSSLKKLCSEKVNLMNVSWFCYSHNPCYPSLSKKQNVFLPAWKKEGDIVNSSSVSLGWDSTQILPLFMSLYQHFCPLSLWV